MVLIQFLMISVGDPSELAGAGHGEEIHNAFL